MFAGRSTIRAPVPIPGPPPVGPAAVPADPVSDSVAGATAGPAPRSATDPPRPPPAFVTAGVILDKGRRPTARPSDAAPSRTATSYTAPPDRPGPQHSAHPGTQADRTLAARFLALAAARLADQHSIAELARDLGTSMFHLDRACRDACGRDALDLVYRLRLERALVMLGDRRLGIPAIAQALGYSGPAHFNRAFAAATGRSPQSFRDGLHHGTHPGTAD